MALTTALRGDEIVLTRFNQLEMLQGCRDDREWFLLTPYVVCDWQDIGSEPRATASGTEFLQLLSGEWSVIGSLLVAFKIVNPSESGWFALP